MEKNRKDLDAISSGAQHQKLLKKTTISFKHFTILDTPLQVNYLLDQFTSQLTLFIESTIFASVDIP